MRSSAFLPVPVIVVLLLWLLLFWQLPTRPLHNARSSAAPLALAAAGVAGIAFGIAAPVNPRPLTFSLVVLLLVNLAVAATLAAARSRTVRVWRAPEGEVRRKGTASAAALWVATLFVHLFVGLQLDPEAGAGTIGTVSLYPFVLIGLSAQTFLLRRRAAGL